MTLKIIFVCAIIISYVSAASFKNVTEGLLPENTLLCMNKTETSIESLKKYRPGEEEPTKKVLCFMKCIFDSMGFLSNNTVCVESMKKNNFPEGESQKTESIYKCLEKLKSVSSCEDMTFVEECFNQYEI